jgi:hypothetical protein
VLTPVTGDERSALGLAPDRLALRVKGLGQYGPHGAAKKAGFEKDDILVAVDGLTHEISESALIGLLLTRHPQKEDLPATILRGARRIELRLPMQ